MNDIETVEWDKIKLTVVMPLYNCEKYMRQAITSVLSQKTEFPVLLVITDDASTDDSRNIAVEFERKYPEKILFIFSEKNEGLLANDIKVFEHMKSDYFCVLDPDDYWVNDSFLQKAVAFLETHMEYVAYGSNTKRLVNGELEDGFYINTNEQEKTFDGIEDYLAGRAFATHTTASIYRNVMFQNGVPEIMKNAVGTLAEASFRGDLDRYVMHLKYGKAKFVNDWVGVYRIHENGICQGSTMFHWRLMDARAELDYSEFYNNLYYDKFRARAKQILKAVCAEVYKAGLYEEFFAVSEYDKENFAFLMNELSKDRKNAAKRAFYSNFKKEEFKFRKFIRNKERRQLIFWGAGNSTVPLLEKYDISSEEIACFVDGDSQKIGKLFLGKEIIAPEDIKKLENKYVIIMSSYYKEILERIEREGLCRLEDVVNLFWYDRYVESL